MASSATCISHMHVELELGSMLTSLFCIFRSLIMSRKAPEALEMSNRLGVDGFSDDAWRDVTVGRAELFHLADTVRLLGPSRANAPIHPTRYMHTWLRFREQ